MDTSLESRGQRARLTCTACHRRKIKCDKNIPCNTCTRRGIADSCSREATTPPAEAPFTPARHATEDNGGITSNETVRSLLQRVSQLEARLQDCNRSSAVRYGSVAVSTVEPSVSASAAEPRPDSLTAVEHGDEQQDTLSGIAADDLDAATVLEFLAWGRKKDSDFIRASEHDSGPRQPLPSITATKPLIDNSVSAQLDTIETLLPSRAQIMKLVEFHNSSVLWYHGSYCATIFSADLDTFFDDYDADVRNDGLNLQWLALLFALLTGSMTCSSPAVCRAWGFSAAEQPLLSLRWYEATTTCLHLAGYMEFHTVYSVQAIATLTISAHILGQSNTQSVLLASAGRIAQSLGLHRLETNNKHGISVDQLRKSEAGKRLFIQLCTQDWFSIPFSETYALSPRFISDTIRPLNCNDSDMVVQPESVPTQASYCNYRFDIASLMPQLLDAMAECNTGYTRYEQVLKFDEKMRKLATASMPTFLAQNAPVSAEWPAYVGWARRSLTICASHKIIMIHRKFIGLSFTNSAYSFTRRTCLAAAKTILREALVPTNDADPVLWIEQAFSVAAGIILSLDMLHRTSTDKEHSDHKELVTETIKYLRRFEHNKVATRGVQLLSLLQQNISTAVSVGSRKRRHGGVMDDSWPPQKYRRNSAVDMQSVIRGISDDLGVTSPTTTMAIPPTPTSVRGAQPTVTTSEWQTLVDLLPQEVGFDSQYLFDNFFPS